MARKKKNIDGAGGSWLNTYADMVTLLLTFFILLFSMSNLDKQKYAALAQAFSTGKGVITAPEDYPEGQQMLDEGSTDETPVIEDEDLEGLDILYKIMSEYIKENNLQDDIEIQKVEDDVFIRFKNSVFFDGYSSEIKPAGKEILLVLAQGLDDADPLVGEIVIAGHTAFVKSDLTSSDRTLSSDRATGVLMFLEALNKFDPSKLVSVGYGSYRPVATNDTPEGMEQNRRVEIYISKKGQSRNFTDYIYDILNERKKTGAENQEGQGGTEE